MRQVVVVLVESVEAVESAVMLKWDRRAAVGRWHNSATAIVAVVAVVVAAVVAVHMEAVVVVRIHNRDRN